MRRGGAAAASAGAPSAGRCRLCSTCAVVAPRAPLARLPVPYGAARLIGRAEGQHWPGYQRKDVTAKASTQRILTACRRARFQHFWSIRLKPALPYRPLEFITSPALELTSPAAAPAQTTVKRPSVTLNRVKKQDPWQHRCSNSQLRFRGQKPKLLAQHTILGAPEREAAASPGAQVQTDL